MPHTKSAWKRLRQAEKRRVLNRARIKTIKKASKDMSEALPTGDAVKIAEAQADVAQKLDKAAARGVIHKNKAARLKSRLAKRIKKAAAAPATAAK
jgi:small subunit ribosomal protein S20